MFGKASLKMSLEYLIILIYKEVKIICCLNICFYFKKDPAHTFA